MFTFYRTDLLPELNVLGGRTTFRCQYTQLRNKDYSLKFQNVNVKHVSIFVWTTFFFCFKQLCEDILAGPRKFKGLFEGQDLVLGLDISL